MASLKTLYEPNPDLGNALHTNFKYVLSLCPSMHPFVDLHSVDYVIDYRFATTGMLRRVPQDSIPIDVQQAKQKQRRVS